MSDERERAERWIKANGERRNPMGSNYLEHYHPPQWMREGLACHPSLVVEQQQSRRVMVVHEAKVRELEEQIRVATAINHAFKQSEETLEAMLHTQQDRVRELEERLDRVEQERDQWKKALHSLTPGGSEFANDPSACVEWIRKARSSQHNTILALKRERDQLRARVGELEALNHKLNKALVFAEHGRTLERLQDSETQRALDRKEEHGTRRDE